MREEKNRQNLIISKFEWLRVYFCNCFVNQIIFYFDKIRTFNNSVFNSNKISSQF